MLFVNIMATTVSWSWPVFKSVEKPFGFTTSLLDDDKALAMMSGKINVNLPVEGSYDVTNCNGHYSTESSISSFQVWITLKAKHFEL